MRLLLLACGAFILGIAQAVQEGNRQPTTQRTGSLRRERVKRQDDDGSRKYDPRLYEGFFGKSLWWLMRQSVPDPICMATFVAEKIAVTPCECVVKVQSSSDIVTYSSHEPWKKYLDAKQSPLIGGKVELSESAPSKFFITAFSPRSKNSPKYAVDNIVRHEECGSFFTYNIAILQFKVNVPAKVAWVLTRQDVLYNMAFKRVLAGQALSGRCMSPYYSLKDTTLADIVDPQIITVDVEFQNWDGCQKTVCPDWSRRVDFDIDMQKRKTKKASYYAREVCVDRVMFTKYCVRLTKPNNESCAFKPGTPVYCQAGDLNGLFGFMVGATFECFLSSEPENLIFQGLHISMNWLAKYIKERESLDKTFSLPRWLTALRKKEISEEYEKVKNKEPTPTPIPRTEEKLLNIFADDAADSLMNVYYDGEQICEATQIAPSTFLLPCWCLTYQYIDYDWNIQKYVAGEFRNYFDNPYDDFKPAVAVGPGSNPYGVKPPRTHMNLTKARIIKALDDNSAGQCKDVCQDDPSKNPDQDDVVEEQISPWQPKGRHRIKRPYCYCLTSLDLSQSCDSHYFDDFALVKTIQPVQDARSAWIHTSNAAYIKQALAAISTTDMLGGECFIVANEYIPIPSRNNESLLPINTIRTQYIRVNFAHFDLCRPVMCPPKWYKGVEQQDACWNAHVVQDKETRTNLWWAPPNNPTRMCMTSYNYKFMCNRVDNGTPVFCKSDIIRGFIGFVSKFHMPGCDRQHSPKQYEEVKKKSVNAFVVMRLDRFFSTSLGSEALIRKMEKSSVGRKTLAHVLATLPLLGSTLLYFPNKY